MRILIIGSGPGLSRAVAERFGKEGFEVSLVARTESKLEQEVKTLQASGIKADYKICDVSDETQLLALLEKEKQNLSDVVLFNAFIAGGSLENETWDSLSRQMDINTGAAFHILKTLLPLYRKSGKGKLFFTGGGLGVNPHPDYLGIGMTKAALRNLVYAAAKSAEGTAVHIATVTVAGNIDGEDPKYPSPLIAEEFWKLYNQTSGQAETEIIY